MIKVANRNWTGAVSGSSRVAGVTATFWGHKCLRSMFVTSLFQSAIFRSIRSHDDISGNL